MCNKVETKAGDLYYNALTEDEAFEKSFYFLEGENAITNMNDIDLFVQDNINVKIPLDGP